MYCTILREKHLSLHWNANTNLSAYWNAYSLKIYHTSLKKAISEPGKSLNLKIGRYLYKLHVIYTARYYVNVSIPLILYSNYLLHEHI